MSIPDTTYVDDAAQHFLMNLIGDDPCKGPGKQFVYAYFDADYAVIYVGVTVNPTRRALAHSQTSRWWESRATYRDWQVCCRHHAMDLEARLIHLFKPMSNTTIPLLSSSRKARLFEDYEVKR